jgi:hypothetical protein
VKRRRIRSGKEVKRRRSEEKKKNEKMIKK